MVDMESLEIGFSLQTAIISEKKKHYVGWTGIQGKEPDIVGMEGDKNDRRKWQLGTHDL
jgi:hypothetical protein